MRCTSNNVDRISRGRWPLPSVYVASMVAPGRPSRNTVYGPSVVLYRHRHRYRCRDRVEGQVHCTVAAPAVCAPLPRLPRPTLRTDLSRLSRPARVLHVDCSVHCRDRADMWRCLSLWERCERSAASTHTTVRRGEGLPGPRETKRADQALCLRSVHSKVSVKKPVLICSTTARVL